MVLALTLLLITIFAVLTYIGYRSFSRGVERSRDLRRANDAKSPTPANIGTRGLYF
ncbi:MAG: hypothetical protein Q4G43_15575 [Mobilicoccus sp.]|nr:hypothetical protein [Mobilicoccus sp.]